jgi:nucleoid DNA-binding protein
MSKTRKEMIDEIFKRADGKLRKRTIEAVIGAFDKIWIDRLKHKEPIEIGSFFILQMVENPKDPESFIIKPSIHPQFRKTLDYFFKPYEP